MSIVKEIKFLKYNRIKILTWQLFEKQGDIFHPHMGLFNRYHLIKIIASCVSFWDLL